MGEFDCVADATLARQFVYCFRTDPLGTLAVRALPHLPERPIVIHVDDTRSTSSGLTRSKPVAAMVSPAKLGVQRHRPPERRQALRR